MSPETSLYLDLIRFAAAVTVVLSHFAAQDMSGGLLWQVEHLGAEAVIVFFVLSGYVIGFVADSRERNAVDYAVSRAARILSVSVPAVALTTALDGVGQQVNPAPYLALSHFQPGHAVAQALSGLFFTDQIWGPAVSIGYNLPYWSLGYEVWFYVIFGVAFFAPPRWRMVGGIAAAAVAGPRILSLFPIWLLGFAVWRLHRAGRPHQAATRIACCAGGLLLYAAYEAVARRWLIALPTPSWADRAEFWQDYVIAIAFALHLAGAASPMPLIRRLLVPAQAIIRRLAGATFTLYLFHYPVMVFLRAVTRLPAASWENRLLLLAVPPAVVVALLPLTEHRKAAWRRALLRVVGRKVAA